MKQKQSLEFSQYAKALRKHMTEAEHRLWYHLRAKRLNGIKFRRQVPMRQYIADFLCSSSRLVIELDGSQHQEPEQVEYDKKRTLYFESVGYQVLRVSNEEIFKNIGGVLEIILGVIGAGKSPLLPYRASSPRGRGTIL
jgi:very-short-patch-repair endonuclease